MSDEKITKPVRLDDLVYVRTYIDTRQDELRAEVDERLEAIETGAETNVQSDWNETDTSSDAYIKNKPTKLPTPHKLSLGTGGGTALVEFDGSEDKEFILDLSNYLTEEDKNELNSAINSKAADSTVTEIADRVTANENKIAEFEGGGVTVVDNLESTSTTQALSANQGRVLNELVYDFNHGVNNSLIDLDARVVINKNDIADKTDKVSGATANNLASLDADGNLKDSGFAVNNATNDSFGKIPCISDAGVLEGGKYIDFHETTNDADYSVRLVAPNVTSKTITLPSTTGILALTKESEISAQGYTSTTWYVKYHSGFMMCGGKITGGNNVTITFPTKFYEAPKTIVISPLSVQDSTATPGYYAQNASASGFTMYSVRSIGSSTVVDTGTYYYIAVGKCKSSITVKA